VKLVMLMLLAFNLGAVCNTKRGFELGYRLGVWTRVYILGKPPIGSGEVKYRKQVDYGDGSGWQDL
jgi:hypothetical protein